MGVLFLIFGVFLISQFLLGGQAHQHGGHALITPPTSTNIVVFVLNEPTKGESIVTITRQEIVGEHFPGIGDSVDLVWHTEFRDRPKDHYFGSGFTLFTDANPYACNDANPRNIVDINVVAPNGETVGVENINICRKATSRLTSNNDFLAVVSINFDTTATPTNFQLQLTYAFLNDDTGEAINTLAPMSIHDFTLTLDGSEEPAHFKNGSSVNITYRGIAVNGILAGNYTMRLKIRPIPNHCAGLSDTSQLCRNAKEAPVQDITDTFVFQRENIVREISVDLGALSSPEGVPLATTGTDSPKIDCRAENFGWLICPLIDAMLGFVDFMARLISNFLQVPPVQFGELNAQGEPNVQYQIWQGFRNLALGLLMIAMLIMVFGQALSLKIDAYTVKKMLPRIVIAAIGIMLSIYLAAFMVDLFNVLGAGMHALVTAPLGGADIFVGSFGDFSATLIAGVAGGMMIVGLGVAGFVIAVLIPVLMSLLVVYLTLVLRQVIIVMLIIIAPLAFVAWVIPGTEKYFKMWGSTFIKALMMYPLIMLLLASGQIFAVIVTNVDTGQPGWINTLTALVALALPLMLVPATFRMAGGAIAMASGAMANMQAKTKQRLADPNDRLGRNLKKHRELHGQRKDSKRIRNATGLNQKADDGKFKKTYRKFQRYGAAGSLLATGAGKGALEKDLYAAIGQSKEEMDARLQKNPYAAQSYLQYGHSRKALKAEAVRLRDDGNEARAHELEQYAGNFGHGNQAAAGAMLMSLGSIGKLDDKSIAGAAKMFGASTDEAGVTKFEDHQRSAAATFSNVLTQAGYSASTATLAQPEYKGAAVVKANALALGDSGGGFVVSRTGNMASKKGAANYLAPDAAGSSGAERADWVTMVESQSYRNTEPKSIEHMERTIVKHINADPDADGFNHTEQQSVIKNVANGERYGATPEIMEKWARVAKRFDGGASEAQAAQLKSIAQANQKVGAEQAKARAAGNESSPELVQAQASLAAAQAAMPDASNFVQIGGEYVATDTPRYDYLAELHRGERIILGSPGPQ